MKNNEPIRAVETTMQECVCGRNLTHIGVKISEPQPVAGDYSMCPNCFTVYKVLDKFILAKVAEKNIPPEYLMFRDEFLATLGK